METQCPRQPEKNPEETWENLKLADSIRMMPSDESIGRQIRKLRESAGLRAVDLAQALDVDPAVVSNIEHDKRQVKARELATIAEFLGVSQLAILDPDSLLARLPVAPRTTAGEPVEPSAIKRLNALADLHQVLDDAGRSSSPHLGDVPNVKGLQWLDAANLLAAWADSELSHLEGNDDPFTNLIEAIENRFHIDIMVDHIDTESLVGASITDPSFPMILLNAKQPRPRALFTLAHELCHVLVNDGEQMIWHHDLDPRNDKERMANAFAAALAMPERPVKEMLGDSGLKADTLANMLVKFGVSFESLTYRLHNLRIINAAGRDQLIEIGWSGLVEQLDNDHLRSSLIAAYGSQPERRPPRFLTQRAWEGWRAGIIGAAPLASLLGQSVEDTLLLNQSDHQMTVSNIGSMSDSKDDDVLASFNANPI